MAKTAPRARQPRATSRRAEARPAASRAKKISITVDERVLAAVEKEARRAGRSLSAQVTGALARDLRRTRLAELVAAYEAEHGAIEAAELEAVRSEWRD